MKKLLAVLVGVFCLTGAAAASNIADDFRAHYSAASDLAAYNKDINALIGLADFHTGKGTTFPGFDIGATLSAVKPSSNNNISSDDYLYAGFITAQCVTFYAPSAEPGNRCVAIYVYAWFPLQQRYAFFANHTHTITQIISIRAAPLLAG